MSSQFTVFPSPVLSSISLGFIAAFKVPAENLEYYKYIVLLGTLRQVYKVSFQGHVIALSTETCFSCF